MNLSLIEPDEPPDREFASRWPGLPRRPVRSAQPPGPGPAIRPYGSARRGNEWLNSHFTGRQQGVALLFVAACLSILAWYVGAAAAGDRSFTGAVTSSGVIDLNFARTGQVATISVRAGQNVTGGQVLATEAAVPAATAVVAADKAAIGLDEAALAQFGNQSSQAEGVSVAAAQAKLAKDKAQFALDQAAVAGMRIVAPMSGSVITVNSEAGETVTAGSQISVTSASSVPVIMLRTSRNWQVEMVVPANSTWTVKPGAAVSITVPAAHLSGVRGRVEGVLPTPVRTSQGLGYQVLIAVLDDQPDPPLSGMAAAVQLAS
jgi:macrolide-specific efflux system membrane fusion protein